MKKIFLILILFSYSFCGNQELIEKNIEELENTNKKVIDSLPQTLESGKISVKANVKYGHGGATTIEILEHNFTSKNPKSYKEEEIELSK